MSLRWFVYYCAVWAGFAAYLGWALGKMSPIEQPVFQAALRGLFLGLVVAVVLVLVDLTFNGAGADGSGAMLRPLVGGLVGGLGGFVGGMLGQLLYGGTQAEWVLVVGWALTGTLIGSAPGMHEWLARKAGNEDASGAARKVRNGMIGGGVGGVLGGFGFLALRGLWGLALAERADEFWSPTAIGFVILGMCIGLLTGAAQVMLKEAWVRVEAGFRAGREMILTRAETTVGRAEGCDIALFGDAAVEKLHARIVLRGGRYWLEDNGTKEGTRLNGREVREPAALRDGDAIEAGRAKLRFNERAKRGEA
ncbi:MAG: FHA domain-containing protein [Gemmataceae bacterium]|nr:FHA domain-containing protein [Gemmataceae bacterium]